ncbi:MAG: WD40 repeat domain-containing protein [Pirellulales bacterium]
MAEQRTIARDHAIAGQAAALREREQALQEAEGQRSAAVRNALQSEELVRTLTTERGLMAGERRETAIAARWFAESSRMAVSGVHERQVNLMRARTYGRQSLRPIMAFQHDTGEPGRVQRLTFSPDERMLASRVESPLYEWNDVRVWDLKSGQQLVIPKIPIATAVAWSPDGSILAAGDKSGHIVLMRENTVLAEWEVRTAGWSAIFENAANTVVELCFSPDGRHLAVGAGRQLLLWSVEDYSKPIRSHLHDDLILSIVFSPDGKMITTLSRDHIARLFSCADDWTAPKLERPSYVYPGGWDRPAPFRPRFLDGGKTWLTWPNCMSMTDLTAEQHRQRPLRGGYVAQVSPNERWLILGSYNHTNGIADVDSGVIENTINYGQNQGTASASFSPDGSIVCVGGTDGSMRTLRVPELSDVFPPIVGMSYVTYVEFAPSGRWLASAESGGMVRLWKYPRETDFRLVPFGMDSGHSFAEISDDDRFAIAVGQTDRECRLQSTRVIELESTEAVGATLVPGGILLGGKFLPKSPQVALISSTSRLFGGNFIGDGVVSVFNWRTGERLQERRLSPEPRSIDIHPQGHEAAVLTADGVVRILNLPDLTETFQWRAHAPYLENNWYNSNGHLLYSRDGRFLATCGRDRQVRIWDTAKRQLWHQVEHEGQSDEAAFSHDGRYLATSSWDKNEVRITDLETRTLAAPVQLLPDWVFQVSFSPDDQRLAAACRDRQVRVWNWRTGEPVGRPMKHPHEVHRASFANSGNWLLTVCDDGTVRIWDALTGLPLGPPVESMAVILPNLVITKDDRFAVLGGVNGRLQILALQSYLEAGQGEVNDELLAQLDLQGNIRLENGIEYPLTSAEAMHRFQQVSSGDADTSAVDGSDSRQLRWHAHYLAGARALDRKDTFAYLWNLQQQVALGSPIQILGQLDRDIDSADHLFVHDREYDRLLAIGAEQLTALSMPMPALPDLSSLCYRLAYWAGLTEKQARTLFDIESSTNLTPDETVKTAILGALQFRAGEHSKALELLRQAADMGYSGVDQALIESMALHHQGDRARSEVLLMLAAAWIHEPSSSPDGISVRLLREARTLLGHTELIIDWERLGREVTEDVVQSLIPKPPRSIDDYRRRIALWAACGNYGQAEKELIKAMRIDNTAAILWVELATTKLARDDVKGFRDVLSQFIATQFNPETSDLTDSDFVHVVELAILFPGGDANFLSGIDQAVGNSPLDRFLNGIGALSLYRQGKYTEAIQLLDANVQNNSISASANDAFSEEKRELLRSMCRFRLDPNDQTRSEVVAALEGWRRRHREWSKNSPWLLPWTVRIRNRYLEREVEQLIETVASTDD